MTTKKFLFALGIAGLVLCGVVAAPTSVDALSITDYANKKCSGGSLVGTQTQSSNACVSYCQGLTASCCTTNKVDSDANGLSYICTAYTNTTATVTQNPANQCSGELCTSRTWTASVIDYTATQATAALVANPTTISAGQSSILTWSSTGATSCTGTGFSTGGATSGSVSVSPSVSTNYSVSCTNGPSTALASAYVTVNIFTVSCTPSSFVGVINTPMTWSSTVSGAPGAATYSWSGTDGLSGSGTSVGMTYTSGGLKTAMLTVISGGITRAVQCTNQACQQSSCTCSGSNCGIVVIEGEGADIIGTTPAITSGTAIAGGTLTFGSTIVNVGNAQMDEYIQNRFQIDIGNNGTWDTNLDLLGTTQSFVKFYANKMCSGGTLLSSGSDTQDGGVANPGGEASANCTAVPEGNLQSGQCCQSNYRVGTAPPPTVNYTYFDWAVYGGAWSLVNEVQPSSACPAGSYCKSGAWVTGTGTRYTLNPGAVSGTITSPSWSAIPPGTHAVRFCPDQPSLAYEEVNETNNCSTPYVFTVGGPDFTASTPNVSSGQLVAGQPVTFYATVTNAGSGGSTGAVQSQCQIDLGSNGTWDVTTNTSFTNLAAGASVQPVCAPWTATAGTHAVRFCADTGSAISETNESNNCSVSSLSITVSAPTQCADGIDNNANALIDLADPACNSAADTTEETHGTAVLAITSSQSTVKSGSRVTLTWSASEVVSGSCRITSTTGDNWVLSGAGGTQLSNPVTQETTYTLRCTSMKTAGIVTATVRVRLAPFFEEI